jgi:hypothetical protein
MSNKYEIFTMNDKTESFKKQKDDFLFNLPFRCAIVGKSELSGKTTLLANLLLLYYKGDWEPENIYIVSPSARSDNKWKLIIKALEIPESNIFTSFDEAELMTLYEVIQENYNEKVEEKEKPSHSLIVFDDVGYSGDLKSKESGVISLLACNGRHYLISTICIVQKYTQLSTTFRENLTGLILFSCSDKQLDLIIDDHMSGGTKKDFRKAFREATNPKHGIFIVNYSNDHEKRFIDNFKKHITFSLE